MKKILLFVAAIAFISAVAFAAGNQKCKGVYNIANGTHPLCKDCPVYHKNPTTGVMELTFCEDLGLTVGSNVLIDKKCCWRNQIPQTGNGKGATVTKTKKVTPASKNVKGSAKRAK